MTNDIDNMNAAKTNTWQLNALTEALGNLTLTVTDSLSVGRGSDNDLVLGSKQVSRNHAQLSVLNGQLYVKDLESSNGTFINDERISANEARHLVADDTLVFASFSFQVIAPVAATAATTPQEQAAAYKPTLMLSPDTEIAPIVEAEPVQKETGIADILSAADKAEPVLSEVESVPAEKAVSPETTSTPVTHPTHQESPVEQPVLVNEPDLHQDTASKASTETLSATLSETSTSPVSKAPSVEAALEPEHDKTTKTALQEEADPDVLRAKQAATAQFSGTANLGQSRDLGTTGNNAMDQALNNPANTDAVEKKPSGSWFIWVFVAIIIIGLALWLFNTGMV